jgi:hypothetical protein
MFLFVGDVQRFELCLTMYDSNVLSQYLGGEPYPTSLCLSLYFTAVFPFYAIW